MTTPLSRSDVLHLLQIGLEPEPQSIGDETAQILYADDMIRRTDWDTVARIVDELWAERVAGNISADKSLLVGGQIYENSNLH